ncbi:MAG TPA: TIGR03118 family protein [Gemmataceae bacterium]|nr:TIGR03118 family protein [Gemmataceae bacterium]
MLRALWHHLISQGPQVRHRRLASPLRVRCLEERHLLDSGLGAYMQSALASDIPGLAEFRDRDLINPWGFSETPGGRFRISANGVGNAPLLTADGQELGRAVELPPPLGSPPGTTTSPNGNVSNPTSDFIISDDGRSAPATTLFSTEDGTIIGWNASVDPHSGILAADQSSAGAVYKLLAMGSNSQGNFLFATDFHNGKIDVFDKNFKLVHLDGSFSDPTLPAGFAPFGVKNIGGTLFVTYAKQDAARHDDVAGVGNGFIDEFDTEGHFLKRFASQGLLNSPIGMAVAPSNFGQFSGALLVGNFGDSHVSAFNLTTGEFLGQLTDAHGNPLVLNGGFHGPDTKGLWGIAFGNGRQGAATNALFFAAGINDEKDGVFGMVTVAKNAHAPGKDHDDIGRHDHDDPHARASVTPATLSEMSGPSGPAKKANMDSSRSHDTITHRHQTPPTSAAAGSQAMDLEVHHGQALTAAEADAFFSAFGQDMLN